MQPVNVRVKEKTKKAARKVLADIGLDLSTGVNLFLHQVAIEKGLPFTPTKNSAALRAKWDAEAAEARRGKKYKNAKEVLADL